jgi:hypothetical protein
MSSLWKSHGRLCAILAVAALTGCREITTTTQIFPDGSCERTIKCSGDSTDVHSIFEGPFPLPVDSTWNITQKVDSTTRTTKIKAGKTTEKGNNRITIATKRFQSVSDLNRLYQKKWKDSLKVEVEVRLDKRFRWFNTFFEYRETYKACTPFTLVPIFDFLAPKELSLYYLKEDTLGLDKKVDQWLLKSCFAELFRVLAHQAEADPIPGLSLETVLARKDSLFAAVRRGEKDKILDDEEKAVQFFEGFYQNKAVYKWSVPLKKGMEEIQKKQEFLMNIDADSYSHQVIMPGLILNTNASSVEGNKAVWKPKGRQFFWVDYVMRVESRVVNRWAIWVTAALLLAVLAALAVSLIRRK